MFYIIFFLLNQIIFIFFPEICGHVHPNSLSIGVFLTLWIFHMGRREVGWGAEMGLHSPSPEESVVPLAESAGPASQHCLLETQEPGVGPEAWT